MLNKESKEDLNLIKKCFLNDQNTLSYTGKVYAGVSIHIGWEET